MLEQDSVLITGSSKEIGAACAAGLAKRGFHMFAGALPRTPAHD